MKLTPITQSDFVAQTGKFRSVIIIDSEPYQINNDQKSKRRARALCLVAASSGYGTMSMFDDKGNSITIAPEKTRTRKKK